MILLTFYKIILYFFVKLESYPPIKKSYLCYRIARAKQESLRQATVNKKQGGLWGMLKTVASGGSSESILHVYS